MSKQNFCLSKGLKSNIIFVLSATAIILFGLVVVLPTVPASTFAEGDDPEEGIVITISPEINASLLSSENGDYKIVKDTVTIGTDALNGYTLYISTDTPEHQTLYLNGDTSSENRINGANGTYESPKTLGDYEWGFAVPGVGHFDDTYSAENPNEDSKFAILPTENKIIRDYTTATSEDTAEVYYGFKLGGTIEPGAYETNITYTAIPATQPLAAKAVLGSNGNLNFLYDRKTYTPGETYEDNIGETTINDVYTVSINSPAPAWSNSTDYAYVNFDISFYGFKPTTLESWFEGVIFLERVTNANNLNTSNVTDMYRMFYRAGYNSSPTFSMDLSSWDTSNVTDMEYMFWGLGREATTWSIGDLSNWDTSNVVNMERMFWVAGYNATSWNIGNLSKWNTGKVKRMDNMFTGSGYHASIWYVGDLDNWNVSNVKNMASMFNSTGADPANVDSAENIVWHVGDLSKWDTKNVEDMNCMFFRAGRAASAWSIGDIGKWNTENVTNTRNMFKEAGRDAATWNIGDISGWNTGSVTNMSEMFNSAGLNATTWNIGDISGWNVDKVTNHTSFITLNTYETNISVVNNQPHWN